MKQLPVGATAPDFELNALNGRTFRLSNSLTKGPVVLAFYKASCPTCQFTFPYLQRIHAGGRTRIVGISQDEPAETQDFVDRFGITFEIAIDEHPFHVSANYGLDFVPAIFSVDTTGTIQLSDFGFSKATLSQIAGFEMFSANDGMNSTRPG